MRRESIYSTHARICVGGQLFGYNGKMPGVLEEILIAIDYNQTIYLLGDLGELSAEFAKFLMENCTLSL